MRMIIGTLVTLLAAPIGAWAEQTRSPSLPTLAQLTSQLQSGTVPAVGAVKEHDVTAETARPCPTSAQGIRDMTWPEIERCYAPDFPRIWFEDREISVDELCHVAGERLELIGPVKTIPVCREDWEDWYECRRYEHVRVSIPVAYQEEVCDTRYDPADPCENPRIVTRRRPLTVEVGIFERSYHEDHVPLAVKPYTIPACTDRPGS